MSAHIADYSRMGTSKGRSETAEHAEIRRMRAELGVSFSAFARRADLSATTLTRGLPDPAHEFSRETMEALRRAYAEILAERTALIQEASAALEPDDVSPSAKEAEPIDRGLLRLAANQVLRIALDLTPSRADELANSIVDMYVVMSRVRRP